MHGGDFRPRADPWRALDAVRVLPPARAFGPKEAALQEAVAALRTWARKNREAVAAGLLELDQQWPLVQMHEEPGWCAAKRDAGINWPWTRSARDRRWPSIRVELGAVDGRRHSAGPLKGTISPAIGALFPTKTPPSRVAVLDVGANMDASRPIFHQFACWGDLQPHVREWPNPRIGLLNIGEERAKAMTSRCKLSACWMAEIRLRFAGNCEAATLSGRRCVVVTAIPATCAAQVLESVAGVLLDVLLA